MPLVDTQATLFLQALTPADLHKALTRELAAIGATVRIVSMVPASVGTAKVLHTLIVVVELA